MNTKCLACYGTLETGATQEYHHKCSKILFGKSTAPRVDYSLGEINELADRVIKQRLTIPGVQPKLSLTLEKPSTPRSPDSRLTIVGLWNGLYVLKPPTKEYPQLPEIEDLTMHMAQACGIKSATHSLIRFKTGELAYLSKRFDRVVRRKKVEKLHQEDMCQLLGLLTEYKYNGSMEKVAKAARQYTTYTGLEMLALFKLTIFSFLTGNSDMHLKNFSLLEQEDGTIELTPAYDLLATHLVMPEDAEELALSLNGKKNKFTRNDFDTFAEYCQIPSKAAQNMYKDFADKLPELKTWIDQSFLTQNMKTAYWQLITDRAERLEL